MKFASLIWTIVNSAYDQIRRLCRKMLSLGIFALLRKMDSDIKSNNEHLLKHKWHPIYILDITIWVVVTYFYVKSFGNVFKLAFWKLYKTWCNNDNQQMVIFITWLYYTPMDTLLGTGSMCCSHVISQAILDVFEIIYMFYNITNYYTCMFGVVLSWFS